MSNFDLKGESADRFISSAYQQAEEILKLDIGEANFASELRQLAGLIPELKKEYRDTNNPNVDYKRADYRRAYVLYYLAPYAAQLAYWIEKFGLEERLESSQTVILIGTGPSPEMVALEHFFSGKFFYHCVDINTEWQGQIPLTRWNRRSKPNHEYHFADVSDPNCWERLPIDFSKIDLVVCQNFFNEIPLSKTDAFSQSFAVLFDSLSKGTELLFSDLSGYHGDRHLRKLQEFWNEHHFIAGDATEIEVHIPPGKFPNYLGPLKDEQGREMRYVWRRRRILTFGRHIIKTGTASAAELSQQYTGQFSRLPTKHIPNQGPF